MLAALIIALVIIGALIAVAIALANNVTDKERDVNYYKGESKSYQERYWNGDRRVSFEIEKERKEHESELRIAEAAALADVRLAEQDGENRIELKKLRRISKHTAKAYAKLNDLYDQTGGFGPDYGPDYGPDGDLSAADFPQPAPVDTTSTAPPFPEAASTTGA